MASAFPHKTPLEHAPSEQTELVIDQDRSSDVFQALSSETAQVVLETLTKTPKTASEIAESIGRSVQNVSYHLDRLCDADVIAPIDTWYSDKGREMTVYGLATERLVVKLGCGDGPNSRGPESQTDI